jgi:predicted HD phosphohydrolase
LLRKQGIELRRIANKPENLFIERARPIMARHDAQTVEDVRALTEKYQAPVFGPVKVVDLLERLALCIDPLDAHLGCVSQLTHALQTADAMRADGIDDRDLLVAALIHDVGKLVLLTGEDPANVGGPIRPIVVGGVGEGLDHCILQWGHDELAYQRFKHHVPEHIAWLIRYHSLWMPGCVSYLDERDARYERDYHAVFRRYDGASKSLFRPPESGIEDYRDLIEEAFPEPIVF